MNIITSVLAMRYSREERAISNIFDTQYADAVPVNVSFFAVFTIQGELSDAGHTNMFGLKVIDMDAKTIWALSQEYPITLMENARGSMGTATMDPFVTLQIPAFGTYMVCFEVDRKVVRQLPLTVVPTGSDDDRPHLPKWPVQRHEFPH